MDRAGDAGGQVGARAQDLKERASDAVDDLKQRAVESVETIKSRAHESVESIRDRASEIREQIPSAREMTTQARDWVSHGLQEQPLAFALGALALGVLASAFIPVTDKERQLLEPAKQKAQEKISEAGQALEQKLSGNAEDSNVGTQSPQSGAVPTAASGSQGPVDVLGAPATTGAPYGSRH